MPLLYITGAPGSGKSTILKELLHRGAKAYDLDDDALGGPFNKATNKLVVIPSADLRTPEWFKQHEWRINIPFLESLKTLAVANTTFVCGVAADDQKILPLFDSVFYLSIDDALLVERLKNRTDNDYGKNDFEIEEILQRKHALDERYMNSDAIKIDASKSPEDIASLVFQYPEK